MTLIHIGFPKAASTLLQRHLFVPSDEMVSLAKPDIKREPELQVLLNTIRSCDSALIRDELPALRRIIAEKTKDPSLTPVLSYEEIAVGPYWPIRNPHTADRVSVARSLAELLPGAEVLVVARDPESWLPSCYTEAVAEGCRLPGFRAWMDDQLSSVHRGSILDSLRLESLERCYGDLFGSDKVHVMDFADVGRDPQAFLDSVAAIAGVQPIQLPAESTVNARSSKAVVRYRRLKKRIGPLARLEEIVPDRVTVAAKKLTSRHLSSLDTAYEDRHLQAIQPLRDEYEAVVAGYKARRTGPERVELEAES